MSINDKAVVTLQVNGEQAKRFMADYERQIKDTKDAIRAMEAAHADPKLIEKEKKKLRELKKSLDELKSASEGVKAAMNEMAATPRQLEKSLKTLKRQIKDLKPGTAVWDEHCRKIRVMEARLKALRSEMDKQEGMWTKFSKWWFQSGQAVAAVVQGWNFAIGKLRGFVNDFAAMEEQMAGTRKFTGMTVEQVEELNEAFKNLNTRTSREKLNDLAQEAGRLGKTTVEAVQGYVEAADIINVALDELGDGATQEIAKLTSIFNIEQAYGTKDALLKVGSTVNELAQNCTASSGYIVEFTKRLAGVGATAKMTVPEIMAFAATLDANGQKVEMSASAVSRLVMQMFQSPAKIARTVGLDVEKFTATLRRSTTEGILMFLERLNELGKDGALSTLSPLFKDLGMDGVRMASVLANLAEKIDMVKWEIGEANKAFEEGKSVVNEYGIFNNTVQARLDKAKKKFHEMSVELGENLYPVITHLLTAGSAIVRALSITIKWTKEHAGVVAALTASIAYLTIIYQKENIAKALSNKLSGIRKVLLASESALTNTLSIAINALKVSYYNARGQMIKAAAAQRSLNEAMMATPWGRIAGLIGVVVSALAIFGGKTKNAIENVAVLSKGIEEAAAKRKEERAAMDEYIARLSNFNGGKAKESQLVDELNVKYGDFFGKMRTLNEWYQTLISSGNEYCDMLYQQTVLEAKQEQAKEWIRQAAALRNNNTNDSFSYWDVFTEWTRYNDLYALVTGGGMSWGDVEQQMFDHLAHEREQQAKQLEQQAMDLMHEVATERESMRPFSSSSPNASTPDDRSDGSAVYVSRKESEKEQRAAERERRRQLAMQKAEVQQQLREAEGRYEADTAVNVIQYANGLKSYEDYLAEKERLDLRYIEDRIAVYENLYKDESEIGRRVLLLYDEKYQEMLLKRAELTRKNQDAESKRKVKELESEYKQELAGWKAVFADPSSGWYGATVGQEEKMFRLKVEYLEKYRDCYKKGSKEWLDWDAKLQEAHASEQQRKMESYAKKLEEWRKGYEYTNLAQRRDMELGVLEELHRRMLISEEEYLRLRDDIRRKYDADGRGSQDGCIDYRSESKRRDDKRDDAKKAREKAEEELRSKYEQGLINEEEFAQGMRNIERKYFSDMMNDVLAGLDGQTRLLLEVGVAWRAFFENIASGGKVAFEDIGECARTSFAVMGAGMQMYSEMASAQQRIDIANTQNKYDKEIEAMQGNAYKTKRLEKRRDQEINRLKARGVKREFNIKVAEALATTAQNAISAYGAGWSVGLPMALWLAPLLAGLATAMGMGQVAILRKQQRAAEAEGGYMQGGFTRKGRKDEVAGVVHAGEWVASQRLLQSPVVRPLIDQLDYVQRTNRIGWLEGVSNAAASSAGLPSGYHVRSTEVVVAAPHSSSPDVAAKEIVRLSSVIDRLESRLSKPIVAHTTIAGEYGIRRAEDEYARLVKGVTPSSSRSKSH